MSSEKELQDDPREKALHRRIKKIVGQLNAIDSMVDKDLPCEDVLVQVGAVKGALHKVGQLVLEKRLYRGISDTITEIDTEQAIDDLTQVIESFADLDDV